MNSRECVQLALNHKQPDRVPLDLGAALTTGMHVSSVYLLRQALNLDSPGTPVKVVEPYQRSTLPENYPVFTRRLEIASRQST